MTKTLRCNDLSVEDQAHLVELADLLRFVADFLATAEGPPLRADFAAFTSGGYPLEELRGDLRRFAHWLGGDSDR
jgi:hypothetical protein